MGANRPPYTFDPQHVYEYASLVRASTTKRGDELVFKYCPYCKGGKNKDTESFAINLKTGACNCKRGGCSYKGNIITLYRDKGLELTDTLSRYYGDRVYKSWHYSEKHKRESTPEAIKYLKSRGISERVIREYGVSTKKDEPQTLVFPFEDEKGDIKFIKYRNTAFEKGVSSGSKEWCQPNGTPYLYGVAQCDPKDHKRLVMTEGQIDSLSLAEAGIKNAVSVPNGKLGFTWVGHCWDFLSSFEELVVFGDKEKDGSITLLDEMKVRFGGRLKCVRAADYKDCKDANEILQKYGRAAVRECVEKAAELPIGGLVNLSDVKKFNPYEMELMPTGIGRLDRIFYGGLPFGGVTVITGKAGEGKSTFATQIIASALSHGFSCFIYSGELSASMFKETLDKQITGERVRPDGQNQWHDNKYAITAADMDMLKNFYNRRVWVYDAYSLDILTGNGDLFGVMEQSIRQYGTRVVLVDNLMTGIELTSPQPGEQSMFNRQSSFSKSLARIAIKYNVLVLLVAHSRKDKNDEEIMDDVSGSADIVNNASAILHYNRRPKRKKRGGEKEEGGEGQDEEGVESPLRLLKVSKNRFFGKINLKGISLDYDEASKQIYEEQPGRERALHRFFDFEAAGGSTFFEVVEGTPFDDDDVPDMIDF